MKVNIVVESGDLIMGVSAVYLDKYDNLVCDAVSGGEFFVLVNGYPAETHVRLRDLMVHNILNHNPNSELIIDTKEYMNILNDGDGKSLQ